MRNRYATPNNCIPMEEGYSLVWHLMEGEYLPKGEGEELLDMDFQPVVEDIVGPCTVQIQFKRGVADGARGACLVVRHDAGECDCDSCKRQIKVHGRRLLMPEMMLFNWMGDFVKKNAEMYGMDNIDGQTDDHRVIAFQFQASMAADLLPWAGTKVPEDRPPSLSTFLDRYKVEHLARSDRGGEIIKITMNELQHECVTVRSLLDEAATTGDGSRATLNATLLTSLVAKCAAREGNCSEEEFKGFCDDHK